MGRSGFRRGHWLTDERLERVEDVPEFGLGRFDVLGDPRALVQRLNEHAVVARFARGHLGIVGHYRQAHVEAGPFAALGEARAAWIVIRRQLDEFRKARLRARATDGRPPTAHGTGWVAQATYWASCAECRRRVLRRGATTIETRTVTVRRGCPEADDRAPRSEDDSTSEPTPA